MVGLQEYQIKGYGSVLGVQLDIFTSVFLMLFGGRYDSIGFLHPVLFSIKFDSDLIGT